MPKYQDTLFSLSPRIFFAHGPGNVAGTLRKWACGNDDQSVIAKTYSGQFFDLAKELDSEALVIADDLNSFCLPSSGISVESFPMVNMGTGLRYWLNMNNNAENIARRAHDFGTDVAIVSLHYGLLSLQAFSRYRIPVILDMHNTLWPMGCKPKLTRRLALKGSAAIGRDTLRAVVAVSPECSRQITRLIGEKPCFEHIPQYPEGLNDVNFRKCLRSFPGEFRILFAGRIEKVKGIFDIVQAAEILVNAGYYQVKWVVAGTGTAEDELKFEISRRNLTSYIEVKGQLNRQHLIEELSQAHATITPTQAGFPEGLAKAPLESLIAGIPSLISSVVPAGELIKNAAITFPPSSPDEIAGAVRKLVITPPQYNRLCAASTKLKHLLFESSLSYKSALLAALSSTRES